MSKKKIAFIINPISGTSKQYGIEKFIKQFLRSDLFKYRIYYSEYAGQMTKKAKKAVLKEYDCIISVGGDGSINEIFQKLINKKTVMGIIPTGSGNGLARFLEIPLKRKKAIQLINKFPIKRIDTAEINGYPFISIAGVGYDAYIAKLFHNAKRRGFWSYFTIVLKSYFSYQEKEYKISIDDAEYRTIKAFMICFANSNQFGNNVQIAPNAKINDGLIDVCIVNKIPIWAIPKAVILLFTKKIEKSKYYKRIPAKKLILESDKKLRVNIDGDPIKMGSRIQLLVKPSTLNIISPKVD